MKRAAQFSLCSLLLFLFASNAFAILRPRFPHRPTPPFSGEWIIIGEDSIKTAQATIPSKQTSK